MSDTKSNGKLTFFCKTDVSRAARTRARKLDADQVEANLKDSTKSDALLNPNHLDIDKPGLGLFYCIECDRHFPSQLDREVHQRSKLHKRIAKKMQEEKAYTLKRVSGLQAWAWTTSNGNPKRLSLTPTPLRAAQRALIERRWRFNSRSNDDDDEHDVLLDGRCNCSSNDMNSNRVTMYSDPGSVRAMKPL
ncbi:hypothetical protein IEQ34_025535 [Dendrobium chrysotoxum]|uniref:C2H2-type domain-containing protein n=1 Tax=Dendrobium chrysotoxum TaxID=161865 RepID=A0AAV7FP19_DENCH|nr:hypothetical protein IEQ34_025535 [Dendrobium chrysotoxum]